MSSSSYCFLTCIQISQEMSQVVWYSHLFHNFPRFVVIHTVKRFGVVNKVEVDVFVEFSCFFNEPVDVSNLISRSSAFSKSSLNIWKFLVHILLKPGLENFEHCFTRVWDECSCVVAWTFFVIPFFWDWNENWPFPVLWPLLSFPDLLLSAYVIMHLCNFFLTTDYQFIKKVDLGISIGDSHLGSWLSTDGSDLLDNFRRAVQVNESLVDPHLESSPSLRTFTTRSFPCSYSQSLGRDPNLSFHFEIFSFVPLIRSAHTFSRDFTLRLVRVILIRWMATSGSMGVLPVSLKAMAAARLPDRLVPRREWTALSQEQEQTALSSPAAATTSSSKSWSW